MACATAMMWLACLAATPGGVPLVATSVAEPVVVRVYDAARLGATVSERMMVVAGDILGAARFDVRWMACTSNARSRASCRVPVGDMAIRELVARVVPVAPRMPVDDGRLGDAIVEGAGRAGVLATVYADRVTALARQAHADATVLLGRALAHELGHLLLGSNHHAREGLMRPVWTAGEVQRNRPVDWSFASGDVALMRQTRGAT